MNSNPCIHADTAETTVEIENVIDSMFASVILAVLLCLSASNAEASSTIASRLDALIALDQRLGAKRPSVRMHERAARIERAFAKTFAHDYDPDKLSRRDAEDLDDLLRAASIRAFYSRDPASLDPIRAVHAELERRGAMRHYHALIVYRTLLQFRHFEEAAALADASGLEVPKLRTKRLPDSDRGGRKIWGVTAENTIEQQRLTPDPGIRLAMIAQPHCGFSKRAMAAISTNPRATAAFAKHVLVLVPQSAGVDVRAVHRWNAAHPELAMAFVDAETDWPEITDWETPVFQFLQDGKPAQTVVGWPDDSRLETVLRLLDDASAVTAQSVGTDSAKNARTSSSARVRENGGSESRNTRP